MCSVDLVCIPTPKACPVACPDAKGSCGYAIDVSGVRVDSCYVGDETCSSVCSCLDGWNGVSCAMSDAERELSAGLVTETMCALAVLVRTRQEDEDRDVQLADIAHWTSQLEFLSDDFSSQQLTMESALCVLTILDVVIENAVEVNVTLHHMQVTWDAIDAILYFKQYFDYDSFFLSQENVALSGNMSVVLEDYCQVAHLLSAQQVPSVSTQESLFFRIETKQTVPSNLDDCYTPPLSSLSSLTGGVEEAPLSSDYCVIQARSFMFTPNVTTLLSAELLAVTPPPTSNDAAIFIVSVACPPLPPPPREVMCGRDNIGREDLLCPTVDGNNATVVGFGCTGLITYNATCLDVNISDFNCSYVFCAVEIESPPDALNCQCSLSEVPHTVVMSFSAMMTSIVRDFYQTVSTATELSRRNKEKIIVAFCSVLALFAFALWITDRADKFQALRVAADAQKVERREREEVAATSTQEQRMVILSSTMMRDAIASFPAIFNKDSLTDIFLMEMKKSHRWASLLFHYSPRRPRSLRLLVVTSLVNCVLFLNALFFNITHFNKDQSCEQLLYQEDCVEEPSRFAWSDTKCYWEEENYKCHYKEPGSHSSATLLTVLAMALFSMPILVLMELIVVMILIRPTSLPVSLTVAPSFDDDDSRVDDDDSNDTDDNFDVVREGNTVINDEENVLLGTKHDLIDLMTALIDHRTSLNNVEKRRFDLQWGFSSGSFSSILDPVKLDLEMCFNHLIALDYIAASDANSSVGSEDTEVAEELQGTTLNLLKTLKKKLSDGNQITVITKILEDIELSRLHANHEVRLIHSLSPSERGKRLLVLFVRDLAVGTKGDIVTQMSHEDETFLYRDRLLHPVNVWVKAASYLFIAVTNISFVVFVFLFCMNQDVAEQAMFFQSFAIWLAVEVLVISTLSMFVAHVLLPLWSLYGEVVVRKDKIRTSIGDFCNTGTTADGKEMLNICPYLCVSHRVATEFPDLAESEVVRGFRSSHPKKPFAAGKYLATEQPWQVTIVMLLNSLNSFFLFFLSGTVNSLLGYQIAAVWSWCVFGFTAQLLGTYGPMLVMLLWVGVMLLVVGLIKRMNILFKEHEEHLVLQQKMKHRATRVLPEEVPSPPEDEIDQSIAEPHQTATENQPNHDVCTELIQDLPGNNDQSRAVQNELLSESKSPMQEILRNEQELAPWSLLDGCDSYPDKEMLHIIAFHVEEAHMHLVAALCEDQGEDPEVFASDDVDVDQYHLTMPTGDAIIGQPISKTKLFSKSYSLAEEKKHLALYDPIMPPIVDPRGKHISREEVWNRSLLEEQDRTEALWTDWRLLRRRLLRAKEWDTYRLCYSVLVLAFIDKDGVRHDESSIRAARVRPGVTKEVAEDIRNMATPRVEKCRVVKQGMEYRLLMCQERLAATAAQDNTLLSSPGDNDDDASEDVASDEEMLVICTSELELINTQLKSALIAGGVLPAVLEQDCTEQSDEYRYFYTPEACAFVNKIGKLVPKVIVECRRERAEAKDPMGFKLRMQLVQKHINLVREWDKYRLYDSAVVLAFIDKDGERHDETSIRAARVRLGVTKQSADHVRNMVTPEVEECRMSKQKIEHRLLMCQERLAATALAQVSLYPVSSTEESTLKKLKEKHGDLPEEAIVSILQRELHLAQQKLGAVLVAEENEDPTVITLEYVLHLLLPSLTAKIVCGRTREHYLSGEYASATYAGWRKDVYIQSGGIRSKDETRTEVVLSCDGVGSVPHARL